MEEATFPANGAADPPSRARPFRAQAFAGAINLDRVADTQPDIVRDLACGHGRSSPRPFLPDDASY